MWKEDRKTALRLSVIAGILGGLCCLPPILMVLLGLATVAAANDWGNRLYGDYKWHFRSIAFVFLAANLIAYYRRQGICTLDQARRERARILNMLTLTALSFYGVYVAWTYILLHYWGIAAGLPWAQWDETWAFPAAGAAFAAALLWLLRTRTRQRAGR